MPNSKLGLGSNNTGSNVLDILEKYVQNTEEPLCGFLVAIILKRNPKRQDTARLTNLLKNNHIYIRIAESNNMLGGTDTSIMYNLAVKTNGLYLFSEAVDQDFISDVKYLTYAPSDNSLIYVGNPQVSEQGSKKLPVFTIPDSQQNQVQLVFAEINVQNHALSDDVKELVLHIGNQTSLYGFDVDCNIFQTINQTYCISAGSLVKGQNYDVSVSYNYTSTNMQNVELRFMSLFIPLKFRQHFFSDRLIIGQDSQIKHSEFNTQAVVSTTH
ncbi:hypothetical protein CAEBREN_02631 [Caenorhabditis brenneri]|uniref:DUF7154 domain-containing protein n=1 Tax=Caenorhabditis brenneri TaxID=135651 RepID=G0N485_CAEBE|nr:hypothetical protein CAEBREN_02631 [Caenorhabditis brenneri]